MRILIKITDEVLHKTKDCGIDAPLGPEQYISRNCAFALAVREFFPKAAVSSKRIYVNWDKPNKHISIELPTRAAAFLRLFDYLDSNQRVNMKPREFEVNIPPYIINMIGIGEVYKVLSESKTLELVSI